MKDTNEPTPHIDACQGKAFFDVISGYNINSAEGRNEVFKLLFNKKNGALGSVFEDIKKFNTLFPNEAKIFNCGLEQICAFYK